MRAIIQRVSQASVTVEQQVVGSIQQGLLVLLGVGTDDTAKDVKYLAEKTAGLRIFEDEQGKMNCSVQDVRGGVLVVSQFTLLGDCRKGRRPSFVAAGPPEMAERLYEDYVAALRAAGLPVECGRFRTHMDVALVNDGPVTLMLDSRKQF